MPEGPKTIDSDLYQLLQDERIDEFNAYRTAGHEVDLRGARLRGLDLRGLNVSGMDLQDCYFRAADLRGIDFRGVNLEGASIAEAKISGCYFPAEISADEIRLAVEEGTRLRMRSDRRVAAV
jgi:uncharacterized protein YjbI with pentapeptide repeats